MSIEIKHPNPTLSGWYDFYKPCYNPQDLYGDCPATLLDLMNDERIPDDDKVWAFAYCSQVPENIKRLFACWCVKQVWDLLTDERSRKALEVAEAHALGKATIEELKSADTAAAYYSPSYAAAVAVAVAEAGDAARTAQVEKIKNIIQ